MGYVVLTGTVEQEGTQFVSLCPELGIASCGDTVDEALDNLGEAIEVHLDDLRDIGTLEREFRERAVEVREGATALDKVSVSIPLGKTARAYTWQVPIPGVLAMPSNAEVDRNSIESEPTKSRIITTLQQVMAILLPVLLWAMDLVIDFILSRRKGERTIRPTKRIPFSNDLKNELFREQDRQCLYCGARKTIKNLDIDHMDPVARGGSNDKSNLQLLCKPCNQRKGVSTDREFRTRYRSLVPMSKSGPPTTVVKQQEFRRVTQETTMSAGVRAFRATKYITPRKKITSGTAVAGIVGGGAWLVGVTLALPDNQVGANVALYGAMFVGVSVWLGLFWRAKHTGKFDQ